MEILYSLLTFPAIYAGILFLAVVACRAGTTGERPTWLRLLKKGLLYAVLVIFLFFSYTFTLSAALATSYLYFVFVFTALFAFISFLIPKSIGKLFGDGIQWFARSVAAFGYAFVLLTFAALLIREVPLSAAIPKPAILLVAFVSLSLFAVPRIAKAR